jgi:ATP-dependent Clp protease ATP-binding subunit ClpC
MFERYTEKARRVIFFARYEALQYGSSVIAPEHVLLGLMREDKTISARFFPFRSMNVDLVRRETETRIVIREQMSQSSESCSKHEKSFGVCPRRERKTSQSAHWN